MHAETKLAEVPKQVMPGVARQLPESTEIGVSRAAVVQDDGGIREQSAVQEVPHHPAGRREPEEPVVVLQVGVQTELLQELEEDPAVPVHDRFR